MPAILGVSPYKTPLGVWLEKTGHRQSDEQSNREALEWGNRMERVGLEWLSDELGGVEIEPTDEIIQHGDLDWLCCTPDGFGPGFVAEIKAPGFYMRDEWSNAVPDHAQIQAHINAEICGFPLAFVAGIIQPRLRWMRVEHDPDTVRGWLGECERFWTDHVLTEEPPDPIESDKEDGFVRELHPEDTGEIISLSMVAIDASRRLGWIADQVKPLESEAKMLRNKIKMEMGGASFGTLPGDEGAWSWCRRSDGTRVFKQVKRLPNVKESDA